jgi:tetratricopeptide (TPR) repeat protein
VRLISTDTDNTDRSGIGLCQLRVPSVLGWAFREQTTSDFGVDAHVEIKREGRPTGRLLGAQVKTGPHWFREPYEEGWIFRPKKRHIAYWLDHSLPMNILLVDLNAEEIYWQELSERTFEQGPRGGILVRIPKEQTLVTAREPWEVASDKFAATAGADYFDNLERLSPSTARLVQQIAVDLPNDAAILAAHLARGRSAPELTALTLLANDAAWLAAHGAAGYVAIAGFAHSHDIEKVAADALLRAANADAEHNYRYTRNAGLVLVGVDPPRARELLDVARSIAPEQPDPRLEIGYFLLENSTDAGRATAPPGFDEMLATAQDDDLVVAFQASRSERVGDLNTAVQLAEKALSIEPDASAYMCALARLLARRSRSPERQPSDELRAVQFGEQCVDQIHRWAGPTQEALQTLLQIQMNAGLYAKVLERSLPQPDGQATESEARRSEVLAAAATAARNLGDTARAVDLIATMPEGIDRRVAELIGLPPSESPEVDREAWMAILQEIDDSRPEQLIQAVLVMGDLGIDESARLGPLVSRGIITASIQSTVSAAAVASADLGAGLPLLRALSDLEEFAAQKLVDLLTAADRRDDAQVAADAAYGRFGSPYFLVYKANILASLGQAVEAQVAASDALAHSNLNAVSRRQAHRLLAQLSVHEAVAAAGSSVASLWRRAEQHFAECVAAADGLAREDRDVWQLAEVQVRLGNVSRAYETVTAYDPEIRNGGEARLWFRIASVQRKLNTRDYARMLELADKYSEDPHFSAALLGTIVSRTRSEGQLPENIADVRPELSSDLRRQAFEALDDHVERHGDDSPIKIIQAPTTEELVAKLAHYIQRDETPLLDLVEMIRQIRVPFGLLATSIKRPYSSSLAQRGLGYFIACAGREADDHADETAVRQNSYDDVVVDASALLVASVLNEFDQLRGRFRRLLIPSASREDIVRGRVDLDGRSSSSGWIAYDGATGSIAAGEVDVDGQVASLQRFAGMERALLSVETVPDVPLAVLEGVGIDDADSWLAPIALAKQRKIPLWSDDVAHRNLARFFGVDAFGTTMLQQVRADLKLEIGELDDQSLERVMADRRAEILRALEQRVVDVPASVDTVIEQARRERWTPTLAASTVGRPAWWHHAATPWQDLRDILVSAEDDGESTDAWQVAAMWGVSALTMDDPSATAVLLACVALIDTHRPIRAQRAAAMLGRASVVSTYRKAHSPTDYLVQATTELARQGVLEDPQEVIDRIRAVLDDSSGEDGDRRWSDEALG